MDNELKEQVDNHRFIKEKRINFHFIFKNYGKCYTFINELLQTQPITNSEFQKLINIKERKGKWEAYTCHVVTILSTLFYARFYFKTTINSKIYKALLIMAYPFFFFNIAYNLGRHIGGFIVMKSKIINFKKI
jgi:hypothetical protein